MRPFRAFLTLGCLLLPIPAVATGTSSDDRLPAPDEIVAPAAYLSLSGVHPGGSALLAVTGDILPGWHVNAHLPSEDYLIPTELELAPLAGVAWGEARYPEGEMVMFEFAGQALKVYEGRFAVVVPLEVAAGTPAGPRPVRGHLAYQACNDRICLPPARVPFAVELEVADPAEAVRPVHPEVFDSLEETPAAPASAVPGGEGNVAGASLLVFGLIYLGGLALNLTPCVFPLIPITIAFFGGQTGRSPLGTLGLSSLYVLGMSVTYSALGAFAALTGGLFGAALQSPWVLGFVALVLVALSLSQFGVYEFRLPGVSGLSSRRGPAGALFMGLVVGLVAAPCIGPFVVALLATVAREADPVLGVAKFFVLSLGLGTPYLFLGAFSGGLEALPRAGEWMEGVKRIFGLVLLVMAAYFLGQAVPGTAGDLLLPASLLLSALWLLFLEPRRTPWLDQARRVLAVLALAALIQPLLPARWLTGPLRSIPGPVWTLPGSHEGIPFARYSPEALEAARAAGRPVLIDFTADWCVPCREYEHKVFNQPAVVEAAREFVTLQADLTRTSSPQVRDLIREYDIFGPPTIVFLDAAGRERRDLRLVGFVGPEAFLERMRQAAGGGGDAAVAAGERTGPAS